ncbi:MAG: hypothetical protein LBO03_04485 [Acidaminococcales bacterium]|jgi:predicted transcriptional regulator|nr:hypothetical protein [Acidaminococcales bacterium]
MGIADILQSLLAEKKTNINEFAKKAEIKSSTLYSIDFKTKERQTQLTLF